MLTYVEHRVIWVITTEVSGILRCKASLSCVHRRVNRIEQMGQVDRGKVCFVMSVCYLMNSSTTLCVRVGEV